MSTRPNVWRRRRADRHRGHSHLPSGRSGCLPSPVWTAAPTRCHPTERCHGGLWDTSGGLKNVPDRAAADRSRPAACFPRDIWPSESGSSGGVSHAKASCRHSLLYGLFFKIVKNTSKSISKHFGVFLAREFTSTINSLKLIIFIELKRK